MLEGAAEKVVRDKGDIKRWNRHNHLKPPAGKRAFIGDDSVNLQPKAVNMFKPIRAARCRNDLEAALAPFLLLNVGTPPLKHSAQSAPG